MDWRKSTDPWVSNYARNSGREAERVKSEYAPSAKGDYGDGRVEPTLSN
jgi:hypothetical protein